MVSDREFGCRFEIRLWSGLRLVRGLENVKERSASVTTLCLDGLRGCQGSFATGLFLEVLQRAWAFPFWGAQGQAFPAVEATAPDVKWSASSHIWHCVHGRSMCGLTAACGSSRHSNTRADLPYCICCSDI